MSIAITVSFHGGKGLNNLYSYPGGAALLDDQGVTLRELRGFTLGLDGSLYVVVGHKGKDSQVLHFTPPASSGGQFTNGKPFATPGSSLSHPFALVFTGSFLFVSNQDSNTVTQYDAATGVLIKNFATGFKKLRGLTWDNNLNTLYAADEEGGVNWYNLTTGATGSIEVADPVHIVYDGSRYVYIGSETKGSESQGAISLYDTQNSQHPLLQLTLPGTPAIQALAGLALATCDNQTFLFVASRLGMQINQYTLNTANVPSVSGGVVFDTGTLTDSPEFVWVGGAGVTGAVSG